jgi:hypothetical protein
LGKYSECPDSPDICKVDKAVKEMARKFNENTKTLVGSLMTLEAKVESMADKLCHCLKTPVLSGAGTSASLFKLEYINEDSLTMYGAPVENNSPIPVANPTPSEAPQDLDAENICPTPRAVLCLIVDEEDEGNSYIKPSDRVLDELRVLCKRDAEEAMLRRGSDLVENYANEVGAFHCQVAHCGQKFDLT